MSRKLWKQQHDVVVDADLTSCREATSAMNNLGSACSRLAMVTNAAELRS